MPCSTSRTANNNKYQPKLSPRTEIYPIGFVLAPLYFEFAGLLAKPLPQRLS